MLAAQCTALIAPCIQDGTPRSIEQSNGTTSTYDYDHAKRVKLITHRVGGVPSLTLEYDYDSNGNRTDETRTEIALPGQPARTVHTHYGFDSDDRLTSAEVTYSPQNPQTPNTRTVWTLDPVVNRLTEVVTNTQTNQALNSKIYTYSPRDQLETVTDSVTQLRVVYGYDLNGNRTERTVTRGPGNTLVSRTFYRFDPRDRLVKAEPEAPNPTNIPTVEFVYDAEDRKIARIETPWLNGNPVQANAQATASLYDGQTLLHEAKPGSGNTSNSQGLIITDTYRNSAKLDRHVSYGPNGADQPTIRFYQLDALGTPLILTDTNGQAIISNTVDAWGNTVQQTADGNSTAPVNSGDQSQDPNQTGQAALLTNDDQTIGFTGYQKDEDLGLYYAGARFYDPLIGGFGAMDPWTGDTGRPITLNKYLYANGNPVVFVDPDGRVSYLSDLNNFLGGVVDSYDERIGSAVKSDNTALATVYGAGKGFATIGKSTVSLLNTTSNLLAERYLDGSHADQARSELVSQQAAITNGIEGAADLGAMARERPVQTALALKRKSDQFRNDVLTGKPQAWATASEVGAPMIAPFAGAKAIVGAKEGLDGLRLGLRMSDELLDPSILRELEGRAVTVRNQANSASEQARQAVTSVEGKATIETAASQARPSAPQASQGRITPQSLGYTTIADNEETLRMWNDAMRSAASSRRENGYMKYLKAVSQGLPVDQDMLEAAFAPVNARFVKSARAAGYQVDEVHHWNFNKSDYPTQVVDPRNLIMTPSRTAHEAVHRATSKSSSFWKGPIDPTHEIEIKEWYTPLALPEAQ